MRSLQAEATTKYLGFLCYKCQVRPGAYRAAIRQRMRERYNTENKSKRHLRRSEKSRKCGVKICEKRRFPIVLRCAWRFKRGLLMRSVGDSEGNIFQCAQRCKEGRGDGSHQAKHLLAIWLINTLITAHFWRLLCQLPFHGGWTHTLFKVILKVKW